MSSIRLNPLFGNSTNLGFSSFSSISTTNPNSTVNQLIRGTNNSTSISCGNGFIRVNC